MKFFLELLGTEAALPQREIYITRSEPHTSYEPQAFPPPPPSPPPPRYRGVVRCIKALSESEKVPMALTLLSKIVMLYPKEATKVRMTDTHRT